jgi:hypothetical protein
MRFDTGKTPQGHCLRVVNPDLGLRVRDGLLQSTLGLNHYEVPLLRICE